MAVEDIFKKISNDFQDKKDLILKEAELEREKIIKEAKEQAENIFKKILSEAEKEAEKEAERLTVLERLESQKEILSFKRKILDEVFERVKEKFPLKVIKKRLITPDKEIEEDLDRDKFLEEIKPKLEPEISKILWPE